jgi:hypothetical protein
MKLEPFQGVFGLPPSTHVSDDMIANSMPVMEIVPCTPSFDRGLTLFRINPAFSRYASIVSKHGYEIQSPLRFAFIADNFPTDTFTNDYGETFLQKMTDVASQGMQQLAQMSGADTGTEALSRIGKEFEGIGGELEGGLGSIIGGLGKGATGLSTSLQKLKGSLQQGGDFSRMIGGGAQVVDKMFAGHRVDFPNIWRNSGYQPQYTVTIRLYNPNPGSSAATEKYIIGPLAVILALAAPRSDNGKTYNWPFFHKVRTNGIWWLDPGVITNISVIKGGDQQQIAYNQKLAIVDVRIDFASLYTSMILEEGDTNIEHRPTVRRYLRELKDNKPVFTRNVLRANAAGRAGATSATFRPQSEIATTQGNTNAALAARQPTATETTATDRVAVANVLISNDLEVKNRQNGIISQG